ncbi:sugar phosphate isomerase/epimerase [candidate division KSB1 bacterium]|nr:sugar phosphate isomerase/epimerase [candidate division KSB1 bacterium]
MKRREFFKISGGAILGATALPYFPGCSPSSGPRKLPHIGLQLYTVRDLMQKDFEGTIEKVVSLGYTQLEFAGYYNRTPQEVKALLDKVKAASPGNHTQYNDLKDNLQASIESARIIGQEYLILPMLPMNWSRPPRPRNEDAPRQETEGGTRPQSQRPPGPQFSKDDVLQHAEFMNNVGKACIEAGLRFAYHNHSFEFNPVEEEMPMYDMLLQNTNPELVDMELDLYWIIKAGADPLAYFEKYPGRFKLCHVKGMANDEQENMTAVGDGKIDFAKIFAQSEQAGLKYYIVEHDRPEDAIASITESITYLNNLTY